MTAPDFSSESLNAAGSIIIAPMQCKTHQADPPVVTWALGADDDGEEEADVGAGDHPHLHTNISR